MSQILQDNPYFVKHGNDILARVRILRPLGQGNSTVYEVIDRRSGESFAMKEIILQTVDDEKYVIEEASMLQQVSSRSAAFIQFEDFCIVKICVHADCIHTVAYLLMEKATMSLSQFVAARAKAHQSKQLFAARNTAAIEVTTGNPNSHKNNKIHGGALSTSEVLFIIEECIAALSFLQSELHIRHSDIKPENILLLLNPFYFLASVAGTTTTTTHDDTTAQQNPDLLSQVLSRGTAQVKICDIGSAIRHHAKEDSSNSSHGGSGAAVAMSSIGGTVPFLAPELIDKYLRRTPAAINNQNVTTATPSSASQSTNFNPFKSDVFSFGLCVLFIITNTRFFKNLRIVIDADAYNEQIVCWKDYALKLVGSHPLISLVLNATLSISPANRPDFKSLSTMIYDFEMKSENSIQNPIIIVVRPTVSSSKKRIESDPFSTESESPPKQQNPSLKQSESNQSKKTTHHTRIPSANSRKDASTKSQVLSQQQSQSNNSNNNQIPLIPKRTPFQLQSSQQNPSLQQSTNEVQLSTQLNNQNVISSIKTTTSKKSIVNKGSTSTANALLPAILSNNNNNNNNSNSISNKNPTGIPSLTQNTNIAATTGPLRKKSKLTRIIKQPQPNNPSYSNAIITPSKDGSQRYGNTATFAAPTNTSSATDSKTNNKKKSFTKIESDLPPTSTKPLLPSRNQQSQPSTLKLPKLPLIGSSASSSTTASTSATLSSFTNTSAFDASKVKNSTTAMTPITSRSNRLKTPSKPTAMNKTTRSPQSFAREKLPSALTTTATENNQSIGTTTTTESGLLNQDIVKSEQSIRTTRLKLKSTTTTTITKLTQQYSTTNPCASQVNPQNSTCQAPTTTSSRSIETEMISNKQEINLEKQKQKQLPQLFVISSLAQMKNICEKLNPLTSPQDSNQQHSSAVSTTAAATTTITNTQVTRALESTTTQPLPRQFKIILCVDKVQQCIDILKQFDEISSTASTLSLEFGTSDSYTSPTSNRANQQPQLQRKTTADNLATLHLATAQSQQFSQLNPQSQQQQPPLLQKHMSTTLPKNSKESINGLLSSLTESAPGQYGKFANEKMMKTATGAFLPPIGLQTTDKSTTISIIEETSTKEAKQRCRTTSNPSKRNKRLARLSIDNNDGSSGNNSNVKAAMNATVAAGMGMMNMSTSGGRLSPLTLLRGRSSATRKSSRGGAGSRGGSNNSISARPNSSSKPILVSSAALYTQLTMSINKLTDSLCNLSVDISPSAFRYLEQSHEQVRSQSAALTFSEYTTTPTAATSTGIVTTTTPTPFLPLISLRKLGITFKNNTISQEDNQPENPIPDALIEFLRDLLKAGQSGINSMHFEHHLRRHDDSSHHHHHSKTHRHQSKRTNSSCPNKNQLDQLALIEELPNLLALEHVHVNLAGHHAKGMYTNVAGILEKCKRLKSVSLNVSMHALVFARNTISQQQQQQQQFESTMYASSTGTSTTANLSTKNTFSRWQFSGTLIHVSLDFSNNALGEGVAVLGKSLASQCANNLESLAVNLRQNRNMTIEHVVFLLGCLKSLKRLKSFSLDVSRNLSLDDSLMWSVENIADIADWVCDRFEFKIKNPGIGIASLRHLARYLKRHANNFEQFSSTIFRRCSAQTVREIFEEEAREITDNYQFTFMNISQTALEFTLSKSSKLTQISESNNNPKIGNIQNTQINNQNSTISQQQPKKQKTKQQKQHESQLQCAAFSVEHIASHEQRMFRCLTCEQKEEFRAYVKFEGAFWTFCENCIQVCHSGHQVLQFINSTNGKEQMHCVCATTTTTQSSTCCISNAEIQCYNQLGKSLYQVVYKCIECSSGANEVLLCNNCKDTCHRTHSKVVECIRRFDCPCEHSSCASFENQITQKW